MIDSKNVGNIAELSLQMCEIVTAALIQKASIVVVWNALMSKVITSSVENLYPVEIERAVMFSIVLQE